MNDKAVIDSIANETLKAIDSHREMTPFSPRVPGFGLPMAYAAAARLRVLREARGETLGGRKVGFTNRAKWADAGVDRPMWGDVYKEKIHHIGTNGGTFKASDLLAPLLEPEMMLKLSAAPSPDMDEAALIGCLESYSIGYEIIQSMFGTAKFQQADTVGAGSMFAALLVGPARKVDTSKAAALMNDLATFKIALRRDGETQDQGTGATVLGSPLSSLKFLVGALDQHPDHPALKAGDIVSTGIITSRAMPIAPGATWSTKVEGLDLQDISVTFA